MRARVGEILRKIALRKYLFNITDFPFILCLVSIERSYRWEMSFSHRATHFTVALAVAKKKLRKRNFTSNWIFQASLGIMMGEEREWVRYRVAGKVQWFSLTQTLHFLSLHHEERERRKIDVKKKIQKKTLSFFFFSISSSCLEFFIFFRWTKVNF